MSLANVAEQPRYLTPFEINYITEGIPSNYLEIVQEQLRNVIIVPSAINEYKSKIHAYVNQHQSQQPQALSSPRSQQMLNSYNYKY